MNTKIEKKQAVTPDPNPTEPDIHAMASRRVELQKRLDAINDHVAAVRKTLLEGVVDLWQVVNEEEPTLKAELNELDECKIDLDNWIVKLAKVKGHNAPKYKELYDASQQVLFDKGYPQLALIIASFKDLPEFNTPVDPRENIEVKRKKTK